MTGADAGVATSPTLAPPPGRLHAEVTHDAPSLPEPDTDDFVELFRLHYSRLVRALALAGAPPGGGDDIAQEAFARTFRHWRRVRRGPSPAGYVYRVAFRLLSRRGVLVPTATDDERCAGEGPDEVASSTVDLERAFAALPPRRRACALLCWTLDLPVHDAAEALGIAAGTVRKQLELARLDLQSSLRVRDR